MSCVEVLCSHTFNYSAELANISAAGNYPISGLGSPFDVGAVCACMGGLSSCSDLTGSVSL